MTRNEYITSIRNWFRKGTINNCLAVTLTMKQSADHVKLDQYLAQQNMRHFLNKLNKQFFGNSFQRYDKRFDVIPVLDRSNWQRLHYHLIIRYPVEIDATDLTQAIHSHWDKTRFSYHENRVDPVYSEFWLDYMMKKIGTTAEIDFENTHISR